MQMEPLYQAKARCVCCDNEFRTSRVRPSFKRAIKTDSDFCGHYKEGVNPDHYVVRVCPECGFASTENGLEKLTDKQKELYWDRIGKLWNKRDYSDERTAGQALETYKLALLCAQTIGEKDRVKAGILHHIAWLYRQLNDTEQERRFLGYALDCYINVYETEGTSLNNAKLMYLIGELHRRTGNANEAVRWFSRVVNDKRIVDAAMIKACRDQWQLIRSESGADKAEETA